jgi:hypothetical protein
LVQTIDALLGSAFPLHVGRRSEINNNHRRLIDGGNETAYFSIGHRSLVFQFVLGSEPKLIASALWTAGLLPKLMGPLADKLLNAAHFRLLGNPQTEAPSSFDDGRSG